MTAALIPFPRGRSHFVTKSDNATRVAPEVRDRRPGAIRAARHDPADFYRADVTGPLLDSPPPVHDETLSDIEGLRVVTTEIVDATTGVRGRCSLSSVTITTSPRVDVRQFVTDLAGHIDVPGAWFVVERAITGGTEHAHGLMLGPSFRVAVGLVLAVAESHGLAAEAQRCVPVSGWRSDRRGPSDPLRSNVFNVVRYALAVGRHRAKRTRELPVDVAATGVFARAGELSRFAIVTASEIPGPVTQRVCRWCESGRLTPRQRDDSGCSVRCRQRRSRARRRSS